MKDLIKSALLLAACHGVVHWSKASKEQAIKQRQKKEAAEEKHMKRMMLLTGVLHTLAGILYND